MDNAARTVRHLRLRAPSEAAVRRTARVLEDALRTATLPDVGGRMLFVRRLPLGRLAADAQPMSIALAVEEAVARVGVEWRHGEHADAGASPAVWFRDSLEAHVALARRLLTGAQPTAWYWALAVPAWKRAMPRGDAVRAIAYSLAARAEAPVALPRWFAELAATGHREALAATLRVEDVSPLARAVGWGSDEAMGDGSAAGGGEQSRNGEAAYRGSGGARVAARGDSEDHSGVHRLIAAMLLAAGVPERSAGPTPHDPLRSGESATQAPRGVRRAEGTADSDTATSPEAQTPGEVSRSEAGRPGEPRKRGRGQAAEAAVPKRINVERPDARRSIAKRVGPAQPDARESRLPALSPTSAGGLLFLLNALKRIGYSEWVSSCPEWESQHLARRVLQRIAERLGTPADDPGWELVRLPASHVPATPHTFIAPALWRQGLLKGREPLRYAKVDGIGRLWDPSGRLLLGGWRGRCPQPLTRDRRSAAPSSLIPADLLDEAVTAWETALRRWIRRFAGLSMADLVLRPAAISATPTHLDVHFDVVSAEPGIRRAGLDLDPGWVRWFGRVVTFHYDSRGYP